MAAKKKEAQNTEKTSPADDLDLYTPDENRLIVRLTDNGWPDFRIKEFINEIRAGEILGMTASKILEEMDKEEISCNEELHHMSLKTKPDMVNHPPHYNVGGFEVIDIIKTFTEGLEGIQAVDTANAIKYILRWHRKNGVEDLKKAKWYIEHLIKEIEDDSN